MIKNVQRLSLEFNVLLKCVVESLVLAYDVTVMTKGIVTTLGGDSESGSSKVSKIVMQSIVC